ncbi:ERAD-associated E3 ubiquitin-protein ligase doa10 [Leucoagaricus sp. SymC.cos]|nr:ERAD-associated E3 ubiquitin-protein ligase doa10 [Leucoagaricus sp. SymC.cos]
MQEAEEQDTCRICSAPAEPDQPLFHPCKCSGTIRYIHQDCLTTWLAHSKKKTCDVCKHPYSFTKVYAPDMPSRLPTILLIRRLSQHALLAILFVLRGIAVAIIWLTVLPWVTVWTWRMYFSMGESTAWYISSLERPVGNHGGLQYRRLAFDPSGPPSTTFIGKITSHPIWIALSADIFTGQIIASLIVLTFVAVFLLREWISQNARPGVFEDEELFPEDIPPAANDPPPQPLPPAPPVAQIPLNQVAELEQRQRDALRALEQLQEVLEGARDQLNRQNDQLHDQTPRDVNGALPVDNIERERKKERTESLATYQAPEELNATAGPSEIHAHVELSVWGKPSQRADESDSASATYAHVKPSTWDALPLKEDADTMNEGSSNLAAPRPTVPINGSLSLEDSVEDLGSSRTTTNEPKNRDVLPPQLLPLGPSLDGGKTRREQNGAESPKNVSRELLDDFDPEAEMSHYFDAEDDDTLDFSIQPAPPQPNVEGGAPQPDVNVAQANGRGEQVAGGGEGGLPPDLADDLDGNVEDDMEGAMEAIGMRGPIYSVFQNAALMIFVLDTAIGLGVWIPFTIGKCVALLSLNPKRILQILHLPIRLIRIITDPEVDLVIYVMQRIYQDFLKKRFDPIVDLTTSLVEKAVGEDNLATYMGFASRTYTESLQLFSGPSLSLNETVATETIFDRFPTYLGPTEPYFALLGKEVRLGIVKFQDAWYRMAVGSGAAERVFAIGLGYSVVGLALAMYLNILTVGNARTATRAVRNAVRQQLLVIKVAAFIFIELVLFPLGCGVVLDLCTVWLFPEANLQSRIAFFAQAPLTAMFYHWIAGTMFMYSFAVLLSGCRAVMRPGAMWFIKDPQDQNSHPIRDILDRPTLTQLRKIFMSAILYSVVVCCAVGSVAGLLILGNKSILPFRWKNREPLSNVPIDLLFLHLVLPYTMHYFRPKRGIKYLATVVWKYLSKKLRLTSYFFGDNRPEEQYTSRKWFEADINDPELSSRRDGTFRRVPATDNLALPRDMRATARVTESGEPFDKVAEELIKAQNAEAIKAKRDITFDYRVVYIPPGFRYRIFAFILSMWCIGAVILGISVALPITLGRSISYMIATLGVLLPILVALVMDLYIILPARLALDPTLNPRIRIVDTWALGLLYAKIAFHAHRVQPNSGISRGLHHIVAHGWLRPDPLSATREVILPVAGGLFGMIILPAILFRAFQYVFPSIIVDDKFVFMNIYPGIFVVAGLMQSSRYINDMVASWSQAIRDKEFLVEMRLRNHDPNEDELIEVADDA